MLVNSLVVRSFLDPQTYSEYCKGNNNINIINKTIKLLAIYF